MMSALAEMLDQPLIRNLGLSLLHFLWQGAVIAVLFAAARVALRQSSANARYLAGCLALVLMMAAPVVTLSHLQSKPQPVHSGVAARPGLVFGNTLESAAGGRATSLDRVASANVFRHCAQILQATAPVAVPLWLVGIVFLSIRLAHDGWRVRDYKLHGVETPEVAWVEKLSELRLRMGVSQPVRLLKSALVEVPAVIGWLRPVILLPASSLVGLTPAQLESILAHELGHIRRHDYLVNALQTLVETVLFYHPAVWWVSRCVRAERENCCDDLAVQFCGSRATYARALATLEELRSLPPEFVFAAGGGSLVSRIRRLLGLNPEVGITKTRLFSALAMLLLGLFLAGMGAVLLLQPTLYQSMARINIEPKSTPTGENLAASPSYDPYLIQTGFEIIQSGKVLTRVIDQLDLNTVWGRKYQNGERLKTTETMALLRGHMALRPVRNTRLIEILAYGEDREEAAKIANAIADVYRDYRLSQSRELASGAIQSLEERYQEQEDKIRKVQSEMEDLRTKYEIPDHDPTGLTSMSLPEADVVHRLQADQLAAKTRLIGLQEKLEMLKKLPPDELRQVLPRMMQDQILTELISQLNLVEQQLVVLQKDYSPENPRVVRTKAQLEDLKKKIDDNVKGVMNSLQTQVGSAKAELAALDQTLAEAKRTDINKSAAVRQYWDKKRELETLLNFRRILEMKIASEKIDVDLPKSSVVEIVDRAVPSLRPVSPNRVTALAVLLFGVALSATGLLLLLIAPRIEPAAPVT